MSASVPQLIGTFTWAWQNNLVGWLSMDWFLNFWGSLFASIGDGKYWDRFTDTTGLSASDHIGAVALRRDGIWSKRDGDRVNQAWTYQHLAWMSGEYLDARWDVQLFAPGSPFEPLLYGSVLHVRPESKPSFVLRGAGDSDLFIPGRAMNWSRSAPKDAAGRSLGRAIYDGCTLPVFPGGTIHFRRAIRGTRQDQPGTIVEMIPSGAFVLGTIEPRAYVTISRTGLSLNPDDLVYLGNSEGIISRVLSVEEEGGTTRVRLEDDATGLNLAGARLRAVALQSQEDVPRGGAPEHLNVLNSSTAGTATPNDYDVGDYLRISEGGNVTGVRRVQGFEAQITVDLPLPGTYTAPLVLTTTVNDPRAGNGLLTDDPTIIEFQGIPPALNTSVVVHRGTDLIPVFVMGQPDASVPRFRVDREVYSGASQAGTPIMWTGISPGTVLTTGAPLPSGTTCTYQPDEIRRAPSGGHLAFESSAGRTLRTVTGRNADSLVLHAPVPGTADPVHLERFILVPGGVDEPATQVTQNGVLSVQPGQELFAAGADTSRIVVHLVGLNMTALAAGTTALTLPTVAAPTIAGNTVTLDYEPTDARDSHIAPSQPLVLSPTPAGAPQLNVVRELWLTRTFDRPINATSSNLRVVPLQGGSPEYDATRLSDSTLTVLPQVNGVGRVQMPQFWAGEIVRVTFGPAASRTTQLYRVTGVEGTTITLEADSTAANLHVPSTATDVRVTRMVPDDPETGSPFVGIQGAVPATGTNQVRMRVWRGDALQADNFSYAILDGTTARPAVTASAASQLEIVLVAAPSTPAFTITFLEPTYSEYVTGVRREDNAYVIPDLPATVGSFPPQNLVASIAYAEDGPAVAGRLAPGNMLVPEMESFEVDRRQSLVDHELTHTVQCIRWGPMMLCFLPFQMSMLDVLFGGEAPDYSVYVPGTLRRDGGTFYLTIPEAGDVDFATERNVEITLQGTIVHADLGTPDGNVYPLVVANADSLSLATALGGAAEPESEENPVQVRLNNSPQGFLENTWHITRHILYPLFRLSTHGGVVNLTVGSTYGGLIMFLARLVYFIKRHVSESTQSYPATAEQAGGAIRMGTDAGRTALQNESRLMIKGRVPSEEDEVTVVRSVAGREEDGNLIRLAGGLPVGWESVRVSAYTTENPHSRWDWHDYYPAEVPDPTRPALVRVKKLGSSLTLRFPNDVWLADGTATWSAKVLTSSEEGDFVTVELSKPVASSSIGHEFSLAKVPAEDFLRSPDAFVMDYLGGGFLRWFFNPWGEALSRLHAAVPDTSFWWKALRVLTHIAHTSMSTYGWSFAFPGWLLWDREFTGEGPHVSYTEQEASERSGELYTPIGRLFGSYEENDDDEPRFTVGDVMRYYYYAENDMALATSTQDRAGVPFNATPRVVPDVPSDPGRAVPDFLFAKNNANPYDWGDTSPGENNFFPDVNGWIPIGERVEMASAAYVAFTRPGTHRVTVSPTTGGFAEAGQAQDAGLQRLFYNCEVRDVTARVAGQRVLNDATVRLVRGQRARVRVSPNDGRNYGVALLRPQNGELLRLADDGRIVARDAGGSEPAQVNRVYSADELFTHLQRPLVVPVREFTIEVTSQLPVLSALPSGSLASLGALPLDNLFDPLPQNPRPGESVFVIVPVHVEVPLEPDGSTLGGVTEPAVVGETTPAVLRDFVGDGVIYRVTFDAGSVPANPVAIRFTVTVSGETPIPLETTITLQPA